MQKRIFCGVGEFDIPVIHPIEFDGNTQFVGFNYLQTCKTPEEKGLHFFVDDYQFNRIWTNIDKYVFHLMRFRYVMSPDFSTYTDFPKAVQIYNHYRKHWVGAYLQEAGVKVIPTISWGDESSFAWCFDGEPERSTVSVSSVGCMNSQEKRKLFLHGYNAMIERLNPEKIIFYGDVPDECRGNIVRINSFQDKFKEVVCSGW